MLQTGDVCVIYLDSQHQVFNNHTARPWKTQKTRFDACSHLAPVLISETGAGIGRRGCLPGLCPEISEVPCPWELRRPTGLHPTRQSGEVRVRHLGDRWTWRHLLVRNSGVPSTSSRHSSRHAFPTPSGLTQDTDKHKSLPPNGSHETQQKHQDRRQSVLITISVAMAPDCRCGCRHEELWMRVDKKQASTVGALIYILGLNATKTSEDPHNPEA